MDYELSSDVEHSSQQQDHTKLNNVDTSALPLSSYPTSVSNDAAGTSSPSSETKTQMVVNIGGNPNSTMQTITTTTRSHFNSSTKSNHSIKSNNTPANNTTTNFNIFKSHTKPNITNDGKYKFNLLNGMNGHQKTKWNQFFIISIFLLIFGIVIVSIVTLTLHLSGIYFCKSDKKGE